MLYGSVAVSCIFPRVALIYDANFSGYFFGRVGGAGFNHQGKELEYRLWKTNYVESYSYTTMGEFVDAWNALTGEYSAIYILGHGTAGQLHCSGESIATNDEAYKFSDLKSVSAFNVHLYVCNGATLDVHGNSTAKIFAKITGAKVTAVQNGKMNFSWYGCYPKLAKGGVWTTVSSY